MTKTCPLAHLTRSTCSYYPAHQKFKDRYTVFTRYINRSSHNPQGWLSIFYGKYLVFRHIFIIEIKNVRDPGKVIIIIWQIWHQDRWTMLLIYLLVDYKLSSYGYRKWIRCGIVILKLKKIVKFCWCDILKWWIKEKRVEKIIK